MFLLVPAYPGGLGQKAVKRLCVCVLLAAPHVVTHAASSVLCVCVSDSRASCTYTAGPIAWTDIRRVKRCIIIIITGMELSKVYVPLDRK